MEQYIFDKNNGLWYERQGDYYIRCLTVQADEEKPIGLWGRRGAIPAAVISVEYVESVVAKTADGVSLSLMLREHASTSVFLIILPIYSAVNIAQSSSSVMIFFRGEPG